MSSFDIEGFCNQFINDNNLRNLTKEECIDTITDSNKLGLPLDEERCTVIISDYLESKTYIPEPIIQPFIKPTIDIEQYKKQIDELLVKLFDKLENDPLYNKISYARDLLFLEDDFINYYDFLKGIFKNFNDLIIDKELFISMIDSFNYPFEQREAERKRLEEAERREVINPPYKPFMILPIKNFKWRGNLCWVYAYLQYIYRIRCIHDLILGNNSYGRPNISSYISTRNDDILININFTDPSFIQYNSIINLKNLFENINNIIKKNITNFFTSSESQNIFMAHNTKITDSFKLTKIIDHRDKCKTILRLIYNGIYDGILKYNINCYIIISLWFIFNFLNGNSGNIVDIYSKINSKYKWFNHEEEKYNIEDFIHIFILIIAYSVNKEIYTYGDPQELNNKFKEIFRCLNLEDYGFMKKFKDQTCFILFNSSHYINLIKDTDNKYYILDSQYDDKIDYNENKVTKYPTETIETILQNERNLEQMAFPVLFNYNRITYTYHVYYGGNNSFNKFKLKYNLN